MNTLGSLPQPISTSPAVLRAQLHLQAQALPEFALELLALIEHARKLEQVVKYYANADNYDGFGAADGGEMARAVLKHHLN